MAADNPSVVMDIGSDTCKVGLSGDDTFEVIPSIVGRPRNKVGANQNDSYVGKDMWSKRNELMFKYPVNCGIIQNWDDMETVWDHLFYEELGISPSEHSLLLTEPPLNPKANREKMTQVMFETYNVPALYVSVQSVLSLFAAGRTNGIVLDSGEGAAHCVPILGGRVQTQFIPRPFYFAGHDLTEHMLKLLNRSGHKLDDYKIARDVKEKLCYVALDYEQEMANTSSATSFKLPDGRSITIDKERFCCPEALFRPELISMEMPGLHMLINNAIMKCDEKNRKDLYSNIVLAGGSTMFPGMGDRMQKEIVSLAPPNAKVKVIASPQRQNSVWLGGSLLVTMSTFKQMWISREEYDEFGPAIIHKKCQ